MRSSICPMVHVDTLLRNGVRNHRCIRHFAARMGRSYRPIHGELNASFQSHLNLHSLVYVLPSVHISWHTLHKERIFIRNSRGVPHFLATKRACAFRQVTHASPSTIRFKLRLPIQIWFSWLRPCYLQIRITRPT